MDIGAGNIGYAFSKWKYKGRMDFFASVRGPADEDLFSMRSSDSPAITLEVLDDRGKTSGERWFVGREAVQQSLTLSRPESRRWIYTDEYRMLWHAVFSEMTTQFRPVDLHIVTGLPVDYFRDQRDDLQEWLVQSHKVKRADRRSLQQFNVRQATVIPELLGTLFDLCITPDGELLDNIVSLGRVGVLDVGGHNTGFLVADALEPIRPQSRSIDTGCWKAVEMVGARIDDKYPGLDLRDHEVIDCMIAGQVSWRGRPYDISGMVETALKPIWGEIGGVMSRLWNERLDLVIVGGGGAHVVADKVRKRFPKPDYPESYVQVLGDDDMLPELFQLVGNLDPIFSNVEGMDRYGRWIERSG